MENEKIEYSIKYFKYVNDRLDRAGLGFLKLVIDEENKMVYKDELHKTLGIGLKLES